MPVRSDLELRQLSGHVVYDAQVLFGAAARLQKHVTVLGFNLPWLEHMTLLEAFAIHARGLIEFLFRERGESGVRRADGLAADYFELHQWRALCPPKEATLEDVEGRVGKEIAHVTYGRTRLSDEARQWPFAQIAGSVGRPLRVFIDNVADGRVIPGFRDDILAAMPEYLRFSVAVSYPPDWWPPAATHGFRHG